MKPSYFNIFVEDYPDKGKNLIFNTRTQAILEAEKDLALILKKNKGKKINLNERDYYPLIDEGFCIRDNEDEEKIMEKWARDMSLKRDILTVTILVTSRCNFDCPYCFEKGKLEDEDLTIERAELVCKWIIKKAETGNFKNVFVSFYGGEPLLKKDIITFCSKRLYEELKRINVNFDFGIVTNGYLIDLESTLNWKNYGFTHYRITIDGSKKWHNKKRVLKNGKGTFDKIIENIKNNTDDVDVYLNSNYDRNTYRGVFELVDYLLESGLKHKIGSIEAAPLIDNNNFKCSIEEKTIDFENENDRNIMKKIANYIKDRGFKTFKEGVNVMLCPFKVKDSNLTIAPNGDIYKCPVTLGMKKFCVGHISSMDLNDFNVKMFSNKNWRSCFPCVYLPVCFGGCPYKAFLKSGNIFDIHCLRQYFDSAIIEYIINEYNKTKMEIPVSSA